MSAAIYRHCHCAPKVRALRGYIYAGRHCGQIENLRGNPAKLKTRENIPRFARRFTRRNDSRAVMSLQI